MQELGRVLLIIGLVLGVVGIAFIVVGRLGAGQLPGDSTWTWGNVKVFAPFGTMLLLSILLTVILNVIARWRR